MRVSSSLLSRPLALLLLAEAATTQFAVIRPAQHSEIDIAIGGIGGARALQFADHGANALEALGGAGNLVGRENVEGGHVITEGRDVAFTHLFHRRVLFGGSPEDLVVDVGDVLNEGDPITAPDQVAAQHIPDDVTAGMAQVAEVVDRDPAAIDRNLTWNQRLKRLSAPGEGVGEPQGQGGPAQSEGTVRGQAKALPSADHQRPRTGTSSNTGAGRATW